jgi:sporulation protein YlmC with PRC-barrel domain
MAASVPTRTLVKMSDSKLTVEEPAQDIRGREVVDASGEKIGTVENLFIDEEQRKVRFLEVGSGGFLGIGESKSLLPVDLVQSVAKDRVQVAESRARIGGAPRYDPALVDERYLQGLYGYYGRAPYWVTGYTYPPITWWTL